MRSSRCIVVVALMFLHGELFAQGIPRTVIAAEAEGAAFRRMPAGSLQSTVAATGSAGYSGTTERRCVTAPPDDSIVGGSLRSGEFIARTRFTGRWGIRSSRGHKILWLPLHSARSPEQPLLIRAARIGSLSDSLRQIIERPVHSHGADGYPSTVEFPAPGQWLVVASTETDWGCFIVTVGG